MTLDSLMGYSIHIATLEIQHKRHRKKRINKKWRKRYGWTEINSMPHDEIIMIDNRHIWMTKRTFENLKKSTFVPVYEKIIAEKAQKVRNRNDHNKV